MTAPSHASMRREKGVVLVVVMIALALLAALGLSLSVLANVEMRVSANYSQAHEMFSAAEAALELAAHELMTIADWSAVASGAARSAFTDGSVTPPRLLADGTAVSLPALTSDLADPAWQLFAHGPESLWDLPVPVYVIVWVRLDPADGAIMNLRADALGSGGARRAALASVTRTRVLSWEVVR